MNAPSKPMPDVTDPVTAAFWAATRSERLVIPQCAGCGYQFWPPEAVCPECLQSRFAWIDVEPSGTLWSYATYRRALDPAFADEVPYVVGLIELAGGINMYGIMRGDPAAMQIGRDVAAVFEKVTDDVTFVRWRLT